MEDNKINLIDDTTEILSYDLDNIYNDNNWVYLKPNFRYVPYDTLFNIECDSRKDYSQSEMDNSKITVRDYGPWPLVVNIEKVTEENNNFRTALWTGEDLQVTLMSIDVGDDIGLEIHPDTDQFIRIEEGEAIVKMGNSKDKVDFQAKARDDFAIIIPSGTWHNIINIGDIPLKIYSIYAPPHHRHGVVQVTKPNEEEE